MDAERFTDDKTIDDDKIMDDEQIVGLYWARNEQAIAATSVKYGAYCRSIARRILPWREDAEECVNDTWLKAWNAIPPHKPGSLSLFLGKITRELSLNCYKAQSAKKRGGGELALALDELDDCITAGGTSVENTMETERTGRVISEFLHKQPQKDADIFVLRYYYLYSVKQIADTCSMSESKVKTILFRMRKKLRTYLESEDILL